PLSRAEGPEERRRRAPRDRAAARRLSARIAPRTRASVSARPRTRRPRNQRARERESRTQQGAPMSTTPLDPALFLPEPAPRQVKYTIVSVDDHVVEPPHVFERYLPKALRERGPRIVETPEGHQVWA